MKIHLIAIGGSIMHNLAISLQKAGHIVSGSDDEIYEPARSQLAKFNLLPSEIGWDPTRIQPTLDLIILGMHAKADNPELVRAHELGIRVVSFPQYVGEHSRNKKRIVIAGSHGKTTTTSMILFVLKKLGRDFDYLVGARIQSFDTMVKISDAPLIIIEGDEYLSSSVDRIPKIWHYQPHISVITGVAWDHMNVFPTLQSYHAAFTGFLDRIPDGAIIYFDKADAFLESTVRGYPDLVSVGYEPFEERISNGISQISLNGKIIDLKIFGQHNMANLRAAYLVLKDLDVSDEEFATAISHFEGAAKRLQLIRSRPGHLIYQDFAHAPSKVRATVQAVKAQYPDRSLTACVELHTFSSLNKEFLPQYKDSLIKADDAIVFISDHTLSMKGMPELSDKELRVGFNQSDLKICRSKEDLLDYLNSRSWERHNLLLMTSGNFEGLDPKTLVLQ